jgi:L,D-transpeptidase YcbB
MIKKILFTILLSFIVFLACTNKSKEFVQSVDYYDTVRKVTIHAMPEDLIADKSDSIKSYYEKFANHEIWVDKENRVDLLTQINNAEKEGLNPIDYNFNKLFNLEIRKDSLTLEEQLSYDILLTQSFEKLARHYYYGKLNPKEVYENWDLLPRKISIAKTIKQSIDNKKIFSTLKGLLPKHKTYQELKKGLAFINQLPESKFDSLDKKQKYKPNAVAKEIKEIKRRLYYWKDLVIKDTNFSSKYDAEMLVAVKKFQARHGLKDDGVIGYGTIHALNHNKDTRKGQILANLERWRWFARDFGKQYLLINLPNYGLDYVKENDTIVSHKVVVGRKERQTPIIESKLSNFVFNPTWTVPPTIIKEDLAVEAAANRNYFYKNKITIYKGKNTIVSPWEWDPEKANGYRYVQKPGYNNSLGLVKFNFPNRHSVYLHDTNHRDYFDYAYRALSSGCVRVQYPLQLATEILKTQDDDRWADGKEIDSIIKIKKEAYYVKIKQPIYIHQLYWTIWFDKNGLQCRDDIYDIDKILYDKLRN